MTYYDIDGNRIDADTWARRFRPPGDTSWRIAVTDIAVPPDRHVKVSTVWLGLDHNFGFGEPHIFETMAFADESWSEMNYTQRYPTRAAAEAGHNDVVAMVVAEIEAAGLSYAITEGVDDTP